MGNGPRVHPVNAGIGILCDIHASLGLSVVTPKGDYDTENMIDDGLGCWSFDASFAITHLNPETGLDFSFNIGYIFR